MVFIPSLDPEPLAELHYLSARTGGGTEVARLAVQRAEVALPGDGLDAIICCSDLQGMVADELLGVAVAQLLVQLALDQSLPSPARTGVVLAGDLYSAPAANQRGANGDVTSVWQAFAAGFSWVVGVAGNHDDVTHVRAMAEHVHLLDGENVVVDGLRIGGVGGIIGTKPRFGRRTEAEQLVLLDRALRQRCAILVLHEGPPGDEGQAGNPVIRALLDERDVPLTVCGHRHWDTPLVTHPRGQILNVDARVVVLCDRRWRASGVSR